MGFFDFIGNAFKTITSPITDVVNTISGGGSKLLAGVTKPLTQITGQPRASRRRG